MGLDEQIAHSFERWRDSIYRYLRSAGSVPIEAEEITQEAFFRLLRARYEGREIDNAGGWLFRVAHNLMIDRGRQHGPLSSTLPAIAREAEEMLDPYPTPEEQVMNSERDAQIHLALQSLTSIQRNCISLRSEGFRHREIAEILGMSMSSVADALRRALTRLSKESNE